MQQTDIFRDQGIEAGLSLFTAVIDLSRTTQLNDEDVSYHNANICHK